MTTALNHRLCSLAASFEKLAVDQSNPQIIDCRTSEFYNGWPQEGLAAGGHLSGAVNFSASWLSLLSDEQFSRQLSLRELVPQKTTYLYGARPSAQAELKAKLQAAGFENILSIDQPLTQFTGKLITLDHYEQLVPAGWLNKLLAGKEVTAKPDDVYKVIEVVWGPPKEHLVSHVPSAIYLNTNLLETENNNWNRVSPDKLKIVLEQLGVSHNTTVILYDRNNMASFRAANLFMYAGVKDVRVLDGGWSAWERAGYPTESRLNRPVTKVEFGTDVPANPGYVIDLPEAKQYLAEPETASLVSVRSWSEFKGETSGYSYIEKAGRIKGARWGHAGSDSYHMEEFHNPDGTMLSSDIITRNWKNWGINKNHKVAFYCGTGWRASEAFFYAHIMGWSRICVFDGGWYEWSKDDSNPVAAGEPE